MGTVDSQSDKRRVTQIRWPDAKQGPYLISGQWRRLQGRWQMVGYSQTLANEKDLRELQTEDSRTLRLPAIRTLSAVELRRQLEEDGAELAGLPSLPPSSRQEYRRELLRRRAAAEKLRASQPQGRGRPAIPLEELQQVGRTYAEAHRAGRSPTRAVAETFGISYAAASKRVANCRKVGILGPAEQGKAGVGGKLMGRGNAATLRRLNAAKEIMAERTAALERDQSAAQGEVAPGEGKGS
jgi:hypothetical protein